MKTWIWLVCMWCFVSLCAGCGGSDSSSSSMSSGKFVDGPVQGVTYKFGTYSSVTDAGGTFNYIPGQQVTFSVGGIVLGSATGQSIITPLQLSTTANPTTQDPTAVRIARLLLSICDTDESGNMTIPATVLSSAKLQVGNLSSYTTDSSLQSLISSLRAGSSLVSAASATNHLSNSIYANFKGTYKGTFSGALKGTWTFTIDDNGYITSGHAVDDVYKDSVTISGSLAYGTTFTGYADGTPWTGTLNLTTQTFSGTWGISPENGTFTGSKQ